MPAPRTIYVEFLTVQCWMDKIVPDLRRLAQEDPQQKPCCYIFDGTAVALALARAWGHLEGFCVEHLDFQVVDMRDDEGLSIYVRVIYVDPIDIQTLIIKNADFQSFVRGLDPSGHTEAFLTKSPICFYDFEGPKKYTQIWHVTMLVHIARWYQRQSDSVAPSFILYINQRPWMKELAAYAGSYGGELRSLGSIQLKRWKLAEYKPKLNRLNWRSVKTVVRHKLFNLKVKYGLDKCRSYFTTDSIRMFTEYCGQLNLDNPECHSDVFFADGKGISLKDVMMTFNIAAHPLDASKYKLLRSHGLAAVALTRLSCVVGPALIEVFEPQRRLLKGPSDTVPLTGMNEEAKDLKFNLGQYHYWRGYWRQFFQRYNIKLYTGWISCEPSQMALADAIKDVGGISTAYQRSFEPNVTPQLNAAVDVIFGFSPQNYEIKRDDGSLFRYHIATGYLGDYRFELLRPKALEVRRQLMAHGAKHIIAMFDENTHQDGRWFTGHQVAQDNYRFWLEKLLADPHLGLILKPKKPRTLRRRLGEVGKLLAEAENTGRCFTFEGGTLQGVYPPAAAALAADIAIHDTLSAATAGVESALAGTKTLLMDYEGWPLSPLYKLGDDVVFKDWNSAWDACSGYFKDPLGRPRLGDWSAMIDELDPFHDGLAVYRMSGFLKEMLEGLRRSEAPIDVMDRAAENYARRWGKDKVHRGTQAPWTVHS